MDTEGIIGLSFCILFAIWWIYDIIKETIELRNDIWLDQNKNNINLMRKIKLNKLNKLNGQR